MEQITVHRCYRGGSRTWSWGPNQGTEVPQLGPGAKPRQGFPRPPEALIHLYSSRATRVQGEAPAGGSGGPPEAGSFLKYTA